MNFTVLMQVQRPLLSKGGNGEYVFSRVLARIGIAPEETTARTVHEMKHI